MASDWSIMSLDRHALARYWSIMPFDRHAYDQVVHRHVHMHVLTSDWSIMPLDRHALTSDWREHHATR